ncbi:hypothetical protein VSS74_16425 [Conexibacter stalactiti]|uniref:Uncharacterized protein n=1 Tax=Conexibacter stalactiti TaxID=1940611 RepID=A0ABU4HRJ0_9ACTN|nr:hypothetical protein [Conexibacter stalactiti]MDW5595936.1 hypothetical protein [Conexibacter stalactiti]MEC5036578.1 hypothetical protein [Conexibacter stalactiti]
MSAHEDRYAAQRASDQRVAALYALGTLAGAGAMIWARVITDEIERHDAVRARFDGGDSLEDWERFNGSAFVLVLAIGQVLAFEQTLRKLTGDAKLQQARARFDAIAPSAPALRDIATHLDAYAAGRGLRQTSSRATRHGAPMSVHAVESFVYYADGGATFLELGEDDHLDLHAASRSAIELAVVVERVRAKHKLLAERQAQDLLRRTQAELHGD